MILTRRATRLGFVVVREFLVAPLCVINIFILQSTRRDRIMTKKMTGVRSSHPFPGLLRQVISRTFFVCSAKGHALSISLASLVFWIAIYFFPSSPAACCATHFCIVLFTEAQRSGRINLWFSIAHRHFAWLEWGTIIAGRALRKRCSSK